LPDELCWKYTPKQLAYLYSLISEREVREINMQYKMIRATRAINAPDNFMTLKKRSSNKSKSGRKAELASVGVASETYAKNYNPNLKVVNSKAEDEEGD